MSVAGLAAEIRDLPIGETVSRAMRVGVQATGSYERVTAFRKSVQSVVAKQPGTYITNTVDGMVDEFTIMIRCMVITRVN